MKKLALTLCLAALTTGAFAQGLVNFGNNSTTLISANGTATAATPVGYYYGLFIANPGTTDFAQFTFTGLYATNTAAVGRFNGGVNLPVTGWAAGVSKAYYVAGWSAALGKDANAVLGYAATGMGPADGWFGRSTIATGTAGGFDGTATLPSWFIYGGTGLTAGFNMSTAISVIPEPSSLALLGLGAAALLIRRRK